jgi:hypothetical protein
VNGDERRGRWLAPVEKRKLAEVLENVFSKNSGFAAYWLS